MEEINAFRAFQISSAILSIALIIDTLNFFLKQELYYDGNGLFSYDKLILDKRKYLKSIFIKFPFLFKFKQFYYVMLIRLVCSFLLMFFISTHWTIFFLLFIVQLIFNVRNVYNLSGADQMQTIFLFGLLVFSLNISNSISILTFYFITAQLLFSYFFTGFHKMKSKKWRNGEALLLTLNSETFGNYKVLDFLFKNKKIAISFSWAIMLIQVTFIFCFILFPQFVVYYLAMLLIFHLSIAFLMNLNHFFWVYISSYPIVFFTFNNQWKF